ncbi:EscU/YscU/HrcU family type III secretion system export apparatus switch protein [Lutispora saccharofermentans]|uniref:EscU/YscU/HrcU family type III secretion system export apparatus switch protein n=1 Tax=Lutispora saccharofermentans TaxID=3024236 RepID=A0ABT1NDX1_9FIRM|nr:EscU/YscU/HrcU family type III secretion system export apparatus switch protein [Lutispora saccharofermentans]MCQ1528546.1 EscU/YscU/HrcU family type III secretion system export apparatus switch protein [Lutispora saccharofermentans]
MIYRNINQVKKRARSGPMAAALNYDGIGDGAPTVTASGKGLVAAKIIEMARERSIPIEEDMSLVAELIDMDLGENVPPQLYSVIAEILLLIERMENVF